MKDSSDTTWFDRHSSSSFLRLQPRLRERFKDIPEADWQAYSQRLERHFPRLFRLLHQLYSDHYDFFYHLEGLLTRATEMWIHRSDELKALDAIRENDPQWFQSHRIIGYILYVDLFSGDLERLHSRIPYLKELGVTYLHLMPLFKSPAGDNDGGYAISSYRHVEPTLGTMEQLAALAADLRNHGISLCLDFVFNHTSDEHEWARKALEGDRDCQEYYRMFDDRTIPDEFEKTVKSVFPDEHPGCFTYRSRIKKWVWTTFKNYQWDLNYENPAVFNRMAEELLFLANQGVEILRLDAVAFLWKKMGTSCENLPEAHQLIQAFNAVVAIAAPAMVFKSEAIVHPDEVARYISPDECQLSYNPLLMALLWEGLATRKAGFLKHCLQKRFAIAGGCAWVNYVRCHDDIGWTFSNDDAVEIGLDPTAHRRFLIEFYTGRHPASFAQGLPFQENPKTGDARISGSCASLAGLEKALADKNPAAIELAVRRMMLLYGVIFTIGGIPLIYAGDELAVLNDHSYEKDPEKSGDTRWVHRAVFDWAKADQRLKTDTLEGRIFAGMLKLARIRQNNFAFTRSETEIIDTGNEHVLGYFRQHQEQSVLVLANFAESEQPIAATRLRQLGLRRTFTDIVAGKNVTASAELRMEPCQFMV
ncbi:MAG TPA: amylosucrase, partial [Verrucomicrobiales bacterium]|nr:amylosucrase [Verrucomicrobiales bacterium]